MQKTTLNAEKRVLTGRKVKTLRKKGLVPATVYGRGVTSQTVSISLLDFKKIYAKSGNTGLIDLVTGKDTRPVLTHNVQVHPVTDALLHVEFHQVDLKEKVHAKVPVIYTGQSPAVDLKLGALLITSDEVEIEALPTDLPENIAIDVSVLSEVGQELSVADLKMPKGVTLLTPVTITLAKIEALVTHEVEEKKTEETVTAEGETTAAEAGSKVSENAQETPKADAGDKGKKE
jgi:large subunit ribosomal protein L25